MNKRNIMRLFHQLIGLDNVIGVGSGQKFVRGEATEKKAIIVLVNKKRPQSDLQRNAIVPSTINGLPTDVIEVGDIQLYNQRAKTKHRPAQPGVSIGHYKVSAGTFGALVKDRETDEILILSNNHVLANQTDGLDERAQIGDPILQPGRFDGGDEETSIIGHLTRFVPLYRDVVVSSCPIAKLVEYLINKCIHIVRPCYQVQMLRESDKINLVDGAVAKPINDEIVTPNVLECGAIQGVKEAAVGMSVKKSGRSTGLTYSIVLATNVAIKVMISDREYAVFNDQILAGPMSRPGDSGSLVLTDDNYAVGLLFAGSEQATMFNKIQNVLSELDIKL